MAKEKVEGENVEVKAKKKPQLALIVHVPALDPEGNKTTLTLESKGESAEELVNGIKTPKGMVANVRVTLKTEEVELLRNITGVKARDIFEDKNVELLKAIFRGLI